jgi:hypothetical protein
MCLSSPSDISSSYYFAETLRVKELVSKISNIIKDIYLVGERSHRSEDRFLIPL